MHGPIGPRFMHTTCTVKCSPGRFPIPCTRSRTMYTFSLLTSCVRRRFLRSRTPPRHITCMHPRVFRVHYPPWKQTPVVPATPARTRTRRLLLQSSFWRRVCQIKIEFPGKCMVFMAGGRAQKPGHLRFSIYNSCWGRCYARTLNRWYSIMCDSIIGFLLYLFVVTVQRNPPRIIPLRTQNTVRIRVG